MLFTLCFSTAFFAQQQAMPVKRTTYKTEKMDFGAGGTVTIVGAPSGSISVEGWQRNEIEISADIEIQGETEADLAELTKIDGFVIDNDAGHVRILSIGTHDPDYMKRVAKKFPKRLLAMPFKVDYRIKVPAFCDLEINGGRGDLNLSGIEGAMQIKFLESNARMNLTGGSVFATFGSGSVETNIPTRSWRGRNLDIQLAAGDLNIYFQPNFSADINASILKTGKIENSLLALKPRERTTFTEKQITARAGAGGTVLTFTVGDGTIRMKNQDPRVPIP